jgi:hypothetical protein
MNLRSSSVYLAIIFFLVTLVTCLGVLVVLLLTMREVPSLGLLQAPTSVVIIPPTVAPPPPVTTPLPNDRQQPPIGVTTPTPIGLDPLSLSTRIIVVITSTPIPATDTPPPPPTAAPPTPTPGPSPTPTYPDNVHYVQDGDVTPDEDRGCLGGSIYGTIRDVHGNPVEGVRVKVYNEYVSDFSGPSKSLSDPDAGFYDFIINPSPQTWTVVVVDGTNNPISPEADVIRPAGVDVCYFEVNWKGTR